MRVSRQDCYVQNRIEEKVCVIWMSSNICAAKCGFSFALCVPEKSEHKHSAASVAGPCLCLVMCMNVCVSVCLPLPVCGMGKLFSLVFRVSAFFFSFLFFVGCVPTCG